MSPQQQRQEYILACVCSRVEPHSVIMREGETGPPEESTRLQSNEGPSHINRVAEMEMISGMKAYLGLGCVPACLAV